MVLTSRELTKIADDMNDQVARQHFCAMGVVNRVIMRVLSSCVMRSLSTPEKTAFSDVEEFLVVAAEEKDFPKVKDPLKTVTFSALVRDAVLSTTNPLFQGREQELTDEAVSFLHRLCEIENEEMVVDNDMNILHWLAAISRYIHDRGISSSYDQAQSDGDGD